MSLAPLAELELLLRPAAGGLYVVSTGREEQLAVQERIYGGSGENEVVSRWREALHRASSARAFLVGVPSDVGAGLLRGSNLGPQAIRARLVEEDPGFFTRSAEAGLVDVGDVFVVPQLLHDEMLSARQLDATRAALYPAVPPRERARLPVSPLSMAERAMELLLALAPGAKLFVLGGDHSCAFPAVRALAAARPGLAVVQLDAHTDLLEERLGVRLCFGTWAFHAARLLGGGRLLQVGLRASRRDRAHWESTTGVRQLWAREVLAQPERALERVVELLRGSGAKSVYLSNDIDATDPAQARATGTPEPGGLDGGWVSALIARLGRELPLAGGDVMEVAPPLAQMEGEPARTLSLAARYLRETIAAALGAES